MNFEESQELRQALDQALTEKLPWVAFDAWPEKELQVNGLHFFASAGDAEKFCDRANGEWDFAEQMFNYNNFIYLAVDTLKNSLRLHLDEQVDMPAIARDMAAQNLYLPPGKTIEDMESALAAGLYYPVAWRQTIDPLNAIADYTVVGHRHDGGQVYETGHSIRVMEIFDSYIEAHTFLDSAVLFNELSDIKTDYLLVGRFHDKPLELDMEGYALPHAGLTLLTALHNDEHGHEYQELQSLSEPATHTQYYFAGLRDGKLALFNDKLEPTVVGLPQQPFYPAYYNHEYLTIKNSKIMNQQSYEYNKEQLKNLGFGDEIANALHTKMDQNLAEFTLPHRRDFGKDVVESVLYFSKGDDVKKDLTFFNRFDATLKQEGKEDLTQTFFVGPKYNYTLQERYNMMDGRYAYREQPKMLPNDEVGKTKMVPTGETYLAWRGMDFKTADGYGNFNPKVIFWDHAKEIQKYPIKGVEEKYDLSRILRAIEKGNRVDVVLLREGQETPAKIVANPRMMRFDFYDSNGQTMVVRQVEKQKLAQTEKTELTPQEVQRAAIAKAAEQKQGTGQSQSAAEADKPKAAEQQQQGERRRQGQRVA